MKNCVFFLIFGLASGLKLHKTWDAVSQRALINQKPVLDKDLNEEEGLKRLDVIIGDCKFGKGCPNEKAPSVAVCIVGLSRAFVTQKNCDMLNEMIMQPLEAAGAVGLSRTKPDVFVNVKLGGYPTVATDRNLANRSSSNTRENVLAAAADLGAVDSVIEDGWGAQHDRNKLANPSCFHPHGPVEGVMSYFWSIYGCLQQIKEQEKKAGKQYDHVIHSRPEPTIRPDSALEKKTLVAAVQCEESMYVGDGDSHQTRAAFEEYANTWNVQFQNPNPSLCGMSQSNEHFTMDAASRVNRVTGQPARYIR